MKTSVHSWTAHPVYRSISVLVLFALLSATVAAAPPTTGAAELSDPNTGQNFTLSDTPAVETGTDNLFDQLEGADPGSSLARYKYSVRFTKGKRRKLETVTAASEPLAYRKVRKKNPEADSILLIEIRRDGERIDRSRLDPKSGRTVSGPLSGRRNMSNSRRYRIFDSPTELPDSPFAKLIDQMHSQNIQNILRGKTFQDLDMRMRQALIELQQRRQAAASLRQQALQGSSGGTTGGGGIGGKSPKDDNSKEDAGKAQSAKPKPRRQRARPRISDRNKQNKTASNGDNPGGNEQPGQGNSGIGLGSGIPVQPSF
jgi:hypothetical protein